MHSGDGPKDRPVEDILTVVCRRLRRPASLSVGSGWAFRPTQREQTLSSFNESRGQGWQLHHSLLFETCRLVRNLPGVKILLIAVQPMPMLDSYFRSILNSRVGSWG